MIDPRLNGLGPSPTLAINERSAELERQGRPVTRFGLGQSPFPVPEAVAESLRANAHQKDYLPVKGLPELRTAVAQYYRRTFGLRTDTEDVLVGPGSKQLLFLLQLVLDAQLVLPSPSWVSYSPQATMLGKTATWLPTYREDGWRLRPELLRELAVRSDRRILLLLNYPNNPTGLTYREGLLQDLAAVSRESGVLVLSDEIYGELDHCGGHRSMAEFFPEGTIICSGLSKWCGAGGWRLGTAVFPASMGGVLDSVASVASETHTSVAAPIQYAAVTAFQGSTEIDDYLTRSRQVVAAVTDYCATRLLEAGAEVHRAEGGFYLFPDFSPLAERLKRRGISTSVELCTALLEEAGVACLPGTVFGRPAEELTLRIAPVNFDGARALAGARDGAEHFVEQHAEPVVSGMNRLCRLRGIR